MVQWFEPPHSAALTTEECDELIAAVSDRKGPVTGMYDPVPSPAIERRLMHAANLVAGWERYTSPPALDLHRYRPGEQSPWHTDGRRPPRPGTPVQLSVVALLSDPAAYEGGTLKFRVGRDVIEAPRQRGTVVVFPADTPHRVDEVTRGERVSAVAFMVPGRLR